MWSLMSITIYTANRDTYAALTDALISIVVIRLLLSVITATTFRDFFENRYLASQIDSRE